MEHYAYGVTQLFETGREHFLLQSEIRIEGEKKLVPCLLSPAQVSIVGAQCGGGIHFGPCSTRKVKKCGAVIISRGTLQTVTDRRAERQKPDRRRCTCKHVAKRQINVNARESQMIGKAVNDAAFAAFLVSQPRKLTVRIIERIRADMENHTR